jgi:ribosomal-protein-alanine N-acetyltransferase
LREAPLSRGALLVEPIMEVMEAAFDPAFGEAWNRRQVRDALLLPSTHALIVAADGTPLDESMPADPRALPPAGFVLSRHAAGEEELLLIAVNPRHRLHGLGEALIQRLLAAARARGATRIFLEMRRGNPAIHLYRKQGFEPIGERRNYYRTADGSLIDAITFGRSI